MRQRCSANASWKNQQTEAEILYNLSKRKNKEEGEWKGTGSASSFRSQQLEDRSKREKHLDMLARLFTNNKKGKGDKCVAVCYHESKLFISSNEKEPKHAKEYIEKLREFANNQTSDNYEELLNLAVEQICHIEPENRDRIGNTKLLDSFLSIANDYNEKISLKQKPSWESLPRVAGELFQEAKEAREESTEQAQQWKCLTPWHDTRKIATSIIHKKLNEDMLTAIETDSMEYINGRHISDPNSTKKLKLHAEMGMIEKLLDEVKTQYIGLTKFSCDDCFAVIDLLNNGLLDIKDFELRVCGRHGKEYSNWLAPNFIMEKEDKIKKWKEDNPAKERILETTSEISKKEVLSNPVQMLEKLQAQIKQHPKQPAN